MMGQVIDTIVVDIAVLGLTPPDIARLFTKLRGDEQAEFFAEIWRIAKNWPGAGWCQQSCDIVKHLDADGRQTVKTLADHLALDGMA